MPHLLLLILLSGQVELNLGPVDSHLSNSSFSESASCGICEHEVTNIGIYCDQCQTWFHHYCASVSDHTYTTTSSQETVFLGFAASAAFQTTVQCHPSLLTPILKARIAFAPLPMTTIQTCHRTWICQTLRKPSPLAHRLLKKFLQGKHTSIETRNIN